MNLIEKKLLHIRLSPEEIRENNLSREHLEKAMFDSINLKCISRDEKAVYMKMMKVFLDKLFPA